MAEESLQFHIRELNRSREEYDQLFEKFKLSNKLMEEREARFGVEIVKLQNHIESLKEKNNELKCVVKAQKLAKDAYERDIHRLSLFETEYKEREAEYDEMSNTVESYKRQLHHLQSQNEKLSEKISKDMVSLEEHQRVQKENERLSDQLLRETVSLDEYRRLQEQLHNSSEKISNLFRTHISLEKYEELLLQFEALRGSTVASEDYSRLREDLQTTLANCDSLRSELSSCKARETESSERIVRLENQLRQKAALLEGCEDSLSKLKEEVRLSQEEKRRLMSENIHLETTRSTLSLQLSEFEQRRRAQGQQLQQRVRALQAEENLKTMELQGEIEHWKEVSSGLQKEVDNLHKKHLSERGRWDEEAQKLSQSTRAAEDKTHSLSNEILQLKAVQIRLETELESQLRLTQTQQKQLSEARDELSYWKETAKKIQTQGDSQEQALALAQSRLKHAQSQASDLALDKANLQSQVDSLLLKVRNHQSEMGKLQSAVGQIFDSSSSIEIDQRPSSPTSSSSSSSSDSESSGSNNFPTFSSTSASSSSSSSSSSNSTSSSLPATAPAPSTSRSFSSLNSLSSPSPSSFLSKNHSPTDPLIDFKFPSSSSSSSHSPSFSRFSHLPSSLQTKSALELGSEILSRNNHRIPSSSSLSASSSSSSSLNTPYNSILFPNKKDEKFDEPQSLSNNYKNSKEFTLKRPGEGGLGGRLNSVGFYAEERDKQRERSNLDDEGERDKGRGRGRERSEREREKESLSYSSDEDGERLGVGLAASDLTSKTFPHSRSSPSRSSPSHSSPSSSQLRRSGSSPSSNSRSSTPHLTPSGSWVDRLIPHLDD